MKKLISLMMVLMMVFVLISCSGITAEQRGGSYDLRTTAGNGIFCADPNLAQIQMFGQ